MLSHSQQTSDTSQLPAVVLSSLMTTDEFIPGLHHKYKIKDETALDYAYELTVCVEGPNGLSQRCTLSGLTEISLGRDEQSSIVLDSPYISRSHLKVTLENDDCWLTSYGVNGTQINDVECNPEQTHKITRRDRVRIGPFELRLLLTKVSVNPASISPTVVVLYSESWQKPKSDLQSSRTKTLMQRRKVSLVSLKEHL